MSEFRKLNDQKIRNRIFRALKESGKNEDSLDPVTETEAWENVIDLLGWREYAEKGILMLTSNRIWNRSKELVGVAYVGPKNPRVGLVEGYAGAIGIKGGTIGLGDF